MSKVRALLSEFPTPRQTRLGLLIALPVAMVLGPRTLAWADLALERWSGNELLTAAKLNRQLEATETAVHEAAPPGTIVAFGGPVPPDGWLTCDGSVVDGADARYAALYAVVGAAWGDGGDGVGPLFSLPDLRGRFLRGIDGGTGRDPGPRSASSPGANTGIGVGTVQDDSMASHSHGQQLEGNGNPPSPFVASGGSGTTRAGRFTSGAPGTAPQLMTDATGGPENRPENAAVVFVIKW